MAVNYRKIFITCFTTVALISTAQAFTYYHKNYAPSQFLKQGNRILTPFSYSTKYHLNPYSTFQNPYHANSARNNANKYGAIVKTYSGKPEGLISEQVKHPNSITNPYGHHGSVYNANHPSNPYKPQKWDNPYSRLQSPYHAKSLRNNNVYGLRYQDSHGNTLGYNHSKSYHSDSIPDTYNHSPFEAGNLHQPYGKNKLFN